MLLFFNLKPHTC